MPIDEHEIFDPSADDPSTFLPVDDPDTNTDEGATAPVQPSADAPREVRFLGGEYPDYTVAEAATGRFIQELIDENKLLRQAQRPASAAPAEQPSDPALELQIEKTTRELGEAVRAGNADEVMRKLVTTALSGRQPSLPNEVIQLLVALKDDYDLRQQERLRVKAQRRWEERFQAEPELAQLAPAAALMLAQPGPESIDLALRAIHMHLRDQYTKPKNVVQGRFGVTGEGPDAGGPPVGGKDEDKAAAEMAKALTKSWGWGK